EAAAPGAEVRLVQPDGIVCLEAYVDQLRSRQHPPAVALTGERDRPLLGVGPAAVVVPALPELAVAVVLPRERHAVGPPGQQALVLHQDRRVPGLRVGIPGQLRRPLDHLLRHVAVVTFQRPPYRPVPWLHAHHLSQRRLFSATARRSARGSLAFPGESSGGAAGRPRPGNLVGRAITRPGRHRHAYRGQRAAVTGAELEARARRDGQAGAGATGHRLLSLPLAPPHLAVAGQDVPELVDGVVGDRPGDLAGGQLEVGHRA